MSRRSRIRITVILLAWLTTSLLSALVVVFLMHRASLDVVHQWKQPADITYDGGGPYYVSVVEGDLDWRGFPLHVERNHFIYAGRDAGKPSYGHMIDFSFHPFPDDLPTFLGKAQAHWMPEGVRLDLPSGHQLFIPKEMFTGGR